MKLTRQSHPEAIERYAHIKPAPRFGGTTCGASWPGSSHLCTRERGHRGPHVAHGALRRVVAVWEADTRARAEEDAADRAATARRRHGVGAKRPSGLRGGMSPGLLGPLKDQLLRLLSSWVEVSFFLFFLAFVGFSIYWLLLIAG